MFPKVISTWQGLTHYGLLLHHIISQNFVLIGSGYGLLHIQCQVIVWTNAQLHPQEKNKTKKKTNGILIKKIKQWHLKLSSAKCWPYWSGILFGAKRGIFQNLVNTMAAFDLAACITKSSFSWMKIFLFWLKWYKMVWNHFLVKQQRNHVFM